MISVICMDIKDIYIIPQKGDISKSVGSAGKYILRVFPDTGCSWGLVNHSRGRGVAK